MNRVEQAHLDCSGLLFAASAAPRSASTSRSRLLSSLAKIEDQTFADDELCIHASSGPNNEYLAVAVGCILSITKTTPSDDLSTLDSSSSCDLEFDDRIEALCWDANGVYLIVGVGRGMLHFVQPNGDVLTSRGLLRQNEDSPFKYLGFIGKSLIAVFENSRVIGIADVPVAKICQIAASAPHLLAGATQKMKMLQTSLPLDCASATVGRLLLFGVQPTDGGEKTGAGTGAGTELMIGVAVVDRVRGLLVGSLGTASAFHCSQLKHFPARGDGSSSGLMCVDVALIPPKVPSLEKRQQQERQQQWPELQVQDEQVQQESGQGGTLALALLAGGQMLALLDLASRMVLGAAETERPAKAIALVAEIYRPTGSFAELGNGKEGLNVAGRGEKEACEAGSEGEADAGRGAEASEAVWSGVAVGLQDAGSASAFLSPRMYALLSRIQSAHQGTKGDSDPDIATAAAAEDNDGYDDDNDMNGEMSSGSVGRQRQQPQQRSLLLLHLGREDFRQGGGGGGRNDGIFVCGGSEGESAQTPDGVVLCVAAQRPAGGRGVDPGAAGGRLCAVTAYGVGEDVLALAGEVLRGLGVGLAAEVAAAEICAGEMVGATLALNPSFSATPSRARPSHPDARNAAEVSSLALLRSPQVHSCGMIAAILSAILTGLSSPPAGFLHRALASAEEAIEAVGLAYADPDRPRCLGEVLRLRRALVTASGMRPTAPISSEWRGAVMSGMAKTSADADKQGAEKDAKNGVGNEEKVRRRLLTLCAGRPLAGGAADSQGPAERAQLAAQVALWQACVRSGHLPEAQAVMARHIRYALPSASSLSHLFLAARRPSGAAKAESAGGEDADQEDGGDEQEATVPPFNAAAVLSAAKDLLTLTVPSREVAAWFRSDVLPHLPLLTATAAVAVTVASQAASKGISEPPPHPLATMPLACALAEGLVRRARVAEKRQGQPFDALVEAELACVVASTFFSVQEGSGGGDARPGGSGHDINEGEEKAPEEELPENKKPSTKGAGDVRQEVAVVAWKARKLLHYLQVQAAVWEGWRWGAWASRPTLPEVEVEGLEGLVRKRLWALPLRGEGWCEEAMLEEVRGPVATVAARFELGLDEAILGWVRESVTCRLVVVEKGEESAGEARVSKAGAEVTLDGVRDEQAGEGCGEREGECSLTRLVLVAGLIVAPAVRIQALLLLFQVPAVDNNYSSHQPQGQHEGGSPTQSPRQRPAGGGDVESPSVCRLLALAKALCADPSSASVAPAGSGNIGLEALSEALRLHRIKAIAFRHGVEAFDPRDKYQIRAVALAIALRAPDPADSDLLPSPASAKASPQQISPQSLADALEFASSWGEAAVDLTGLLVQVVVQRATRNRSTRASPSTSASTGNCTEGSGKGTREQSMFSRQAHSIRDALAQVPSGRLLVVAEDACNFLLGELEDICLGEDSADRRADKPRPLGQLSGWKAERRAALVVRGLETVVGAYLDLQRDRDGQGLRSIGPRGGDVSSASSSSGLSSTKSSPMSSSSASPTSSALSSAVSALSAWVNADLLGCARRLRLLQAEQRCFLSLSQLRDPAVRRVVATAFADQHAVKLAATEASVSGSSATSNVGGSKGSGSDARAGLAVAALTPELRRLCALLCVSPGAFTHMIVMRLLAMGNAALAMDVAACLGSEESAAPSSLGDANDAFSSSPLGAGAGASPSTSVAGSVEDVKVRIDAAVALCSLAAKQGHGQGCWQGRGHSVGGVPDLARPFAVSRDLLRGVMAACPAELLARALDVFGGAELVLAVQQRVEGSLAPALGAGQFASFVPSSSSSAPTAAEAQPCREKVPSAGFWGEFRPSEAMFSRDGILLAPSVVLDPLLRYAAVEMRRRLTGGTGSPVSSEMAPDLEEVAGVLQRSENHMLAVRLLLSSWHISEAKSELLRASLRPLTRQVLGYREIDPPLAVACLVMLPHETMVKELKAAVPSIQSNFSRLRTVALVGEELARLWNDEGLLNVFQGLQANAKWWHVLASLGMKIDPRAFQASDPVHRDASIRALVPELLERNGLDLEQAQDYCRQYDVEPALASLCFVEKVLLRPPSGVPAGTLATAAGDALWARLARRAAMNVEEKAVLRCLRSVLPRLHPLDYEKIRFVCAWMVDALSEEVEQEHERARLAAVVAVSQVVNEGGGALDDDVDENRSANRSNALTSQKTFRPFADDPAVAAPCTDKITAVLKDQTALRGKATTSSSANTSHVSRISIGKAEEEAETCRRYSDIVTYLASVAFPPEATQQLAAALCVRQAEEATVSPQNADTSVLGDLSSSSSSSTVAAVDWYRGVPPAYHTRVPFWPLLADPWTVLEPLLAAAPEASARMAAVCRALDIDRDEFAARRAVASYLRLSSASGEGGSLEAEAFQAAEEAIKNIHSPVRRIRVWRWLCQRSAGRDQSAARAAQSGLDEIFKHGGAALVGADVDDELVEGRRWFTAELRRLRCEDCLRALDASVARLFASPLPASATFGGYAPPSFRNVLAGLIDSPSTLVRRALALAADSAWDVQLWSLRATGDEVLNDQDVAARPLAPTVAAYLRSVGVSVAELAGHAQLHEPTSAALSSSKDADGQQTSSSAPQSPLAALEALRNSLIGKMLADVDPTAGMGGVGVDGATGKGGSSAGTSSAGSSLAASSLSLVSVSAWVSVAESCLRPSPAETRRREDVYLAFCVAALVLGSVANKESGCDGKEKEKTSYVSRLHDVVHGKARSQRRLTTRSRLRAALALRFLTLTSSSSSSASSSSLSLSPPTVAGMSSDPSIPFLRCLAELQETRLPCSEDALASALRMPSRVGAMQTSAVVSTRVPSQPSAAGYVGDACVLVRTWLHDEGTLEAVVELARDVLMASHPLSDRSAAWCGLWAHMDQRGMTRQLLQTAVLLVRAQPRVLAELLLLQQSTPSMQRDGVSPLVALLRAMRTFAGEVLDRAGQIGSVLDSLSRSATTTAPAAGGPSGAGGGATFGSLFASSSNEPSAPVSVRVLLVERCREGYPSAAQATGGGPVASPSSSHPAQGHHHWEDPPQELALSIVQLATLWNYVEPFVPNDGKVEEVRSLADEVRRLGGLLGKMQIFGEVDRRGAGATGEGVAAMLQTAIERCSTALESTLIKGVVRL